jgi:GAF domain-containing protein
MMIPPAKPTNEAERMAALRQLRILDQEPSESLLAITRCARLALAAPIALISLIDDDRQWFMCRIGLEVDETPRQLSFCAHAIHTPKAFVVPDAFLDERFAANPLVTGPPHVRSYLGMPLVTANGAFALGSLCVIDNVPRQWTASDIALISELGKVAATLLEAEETQKHAG